MIKNRDFNILFVGRFIANFGDSMYSIATMLLVYHLTNSVFYSGFALFLTSSMGIVQVLLSPMLDRINIKKSLILFQFIQALLLLTIPLLHHFDQLTVTKILVIMPLVTLMNQLIYPSQISLLPKILKQDELVKGNSLFTIAYQGSDALFNAISGVVIALVGIYSVYYLNSMTFLINGILFMFLSQKIAQINNSAEASKKANAIKHYFADFKEGLAFWKSPVLLPMLIGVIVINFATTSIYANLPSFSTSTIHYSFLMAASGIGILIGSLLINRLKLTQKPLNKIYILPIFTVGVLWALVALINVDTITAQALTVVLFFIGWVPVGILNIISQTIVQLSVPANKLGMAIGSMVGISITLAPLGALLGGFLGALIGSDQTIFYSACLIIFVGCYWVTKKSIRSLSTLENIS